MTTTEQEFHENRKEEFKMLEGSDDEQEDLLGAGGMAKNGDGGARNINALKNAFQMRKKPKLIHKKEAPS